MRSGAASATSFTMSAKARPADTRSVSCRVQGRGVVRTDRRGDAALREPRCAIAQRRACGDDAAIERKRGREARDAAADHDDGRRDDVVGDHGLTASIRVTARRARSAMAGGTFTS